MSALVLAGRLLPMTGDRGAGEPGRVWLADGHVVAVTHGAEPGPAGLATAPTVDVGDGLICPGLVDLHNHLAYDTLPLWTQPDRETPYAHHNSWPRESSYASSVTWPAYALLTAAPEELLAYVETKALLGGTTCVQGAPPANRGRPNKLVRSIDHDRVDSADPNPVYTSTLTQRPSLLAERANAMRSGRTFIYHCSEGQRGTVVADEFRDATDAGCLQPRFVAVHCNAVDPAVFAGWAAPGAVVWSPFSNLWLYGTTTDVPAALAAGVRVCLGSDWGPSGTRHVLGEVKVARIVADERGWPLTDADLVGAVTAVPGSVLGAAWSCTAGRLQPGALADVLVLADRGASDPHTAVVTATERDVELVVVAGLPRYGTPHAMAAAGATGVTELQVAGRPMALALRRPEDGTSPWAWDDVLGRLEQVRADPRAAIERTSAHASAWAGRLDDPDAPLRLALDMPLGAGPVGGLPQDLDQIVVPPLSGLTHDAAFLAGIVGRGFHGGVLDGLAELYPEAA